MFVQILPLECVCLELGWYVDDCMSKVNVRVKISAGMHVFTTWLVRGGLEVVVVEREAMDRRPLVAEVASLACGRPQRRHNAARCR